MTFVTWWKFNCFPLPWQPLWAPHSNLLETWGGFKQGVPAFSCALPLWPVTSQLRSISAPDDKNLGLTSLEQPCRKTLSFYHLCIMTVNQYSECVLEFFTTYELKVDRRRKQTTIFCTLKVLIFANRTREWTIATHSKSNYCSIQQPSLYHTYCNQTRFTCVWKGGLYSAKWMNFLRNFFGYKTEILVSFSHKFGYIWSYLVIYGHIIDIFFLHTFL